MHESVPNLCLGLRSGYAQACSLTIPTQLLQGQAPHSQSQSQSYSQFPYLQWRCGELARFRGGGRLVCREHAEAIPASFPSLLLLDFDREGTLRLWHVWGDEEEVMTPKAVAFG